MRRLKTILSVLLLTTLTTNCAYNPKVDTAGRSGTFNKSQAEQLTNDLIICKQVTDNNVNYFFEGYAYVHNWLIRPQTLWLAPRLTYKEKQIMNNCLTGRGHSVLTK